MANELVKRMIKKDGSQRISFYREDYSENPRDMTDEPLHCEDWSREYSIMNKKERESESSNARNLLEYMINNYGDYKKIIDTLVDNGNNIGSKKVSCGTALVYDRSRKTWVLLGDVNCYFGSEREDGWYEYNVLDGKKYDLDICAITGDATDDAIDYLATNCMTDKVKIMSYGFDYYGDISFYHEFSTDSEGIAWLEKDEFLKYSGCKEEYWIDNDCYDIEKGMVEELEAWGDNEVYGYVVEDAVKYKTTRKCLSGNGEDEEYEETEWEEKGLNSCWGFYGDFDKIEGHMFYSAGLNKEEFEEVSA